ncbi:MAG: hypothetical protein LBR68_06665 [Lachnoclostridium sp.]|jgi:hypothetical protein|nr:hypothetical protein [Lachnoclostridium sp.]
MSQFTEWFTAGKKAGISGLCLLWGVIMTILGPRSGELGMMEYYLYTIGVIGFVNIIFSALTKNNLNYIWYLVVNGAAAAFMINMYIYMSDTWTGDIMMVMVLIVLLLLWMFHAFILRKVPLIKRLVISFFGALSNLLCMVIVFIIMAIIRMPQ